jgi:hypothetical protein
MPVWFGSPIGLKSDALPSSDRGLHSQIAIILKEGSSQATAGMIFSILCCLWKAQNDHRFNNIQWSVMKVISEASAFDTPYTMALDNETPNPLHTDANNQSTLRQRTRSTLHILNGPKILCDASVCLQETQQQSQIGIGILS